ncbi:hypothetical protein [Aliikangiella sp. G2MR2-5]|uniref:hypothetical protein n=1 Tax=Aliikangiella sp. G2MR2-5 TaxID=2788943 RepID=UPI0018AC60DA|nr:hypothetical protein [Aliikangiella sp. G2MR2-5]
MKSKSVLYSAVLSSTLLVTSCAVHVSANSQNGYQDLDTVLGGVTVEHNAKVRDISSVNGGVSLGSKAIARNVDVVNGGVDIADDVSLRNLETVNGGISAGKGLQVEYSIETVNGGIDLREGSKVGKNVITVNGDINLNRVVVLQNVKTINGDIRLLEGSVVNGDIIVERSEGWFSGWNEDELIIKIDESSSVTGKIHLYKPVKLEIAETAKVGEIMYHYARK